MGDLYRRCNGVALWDCSLGMGSRDPFRGTNDSSLIGNTDMINMEILLGSLCFVGAILTLGLIPNLGRILSKMVLFSWREKDSHLVCRYSFSVNVDNYYHSRCKADIRTIIYMIADSSIHAGNWGGFGPFLFWLPWGISLGAATFAYYIRRRGRCKRCGEPLRKFSKSKRMVVCSTNKGAILKIK